MATRIVAVGDNVVDCYPALGRMFPGGNCVNVAVYAARFGAESAYIGAVANDTAGRLLETALTTEGVSTSRLRTVDGFTAYCVIGNIDGDRVFVSSAKGVSEFEPDGEDLHFVSGFDAVHVGRSSGLDAHLEQFSRLALLSYDFSTITDERHIARVAGLCYLASFSGGDLDDDEIRKLLHVSTAAGARWTLVTRGRRGAILANATDTWVAAAESVAAIDTLGAGDTFTARVLLGLLRGEDPDAFLVEAAKAAASTCTQQGAFGFGADLELPVLINH